MKNFNQFLNETYTRNPEDNTWAVFKIWYGKKSFVTKLAKEVSNNLVKETDYGVKYSDLSVPKFSYEKAKSIIAHNIGIDDKWGIVNKDGVQKLFDWRIKYPDKYADDFA